MTKTLNQIFPPSTKIKIFFQQHRESEYLKKKKTHSPHWKLNGRPLTFSAKHILRSGV